MLRRNEGKWRSVVLLAFFLAMIYGVSFASSVPTGAEISINETLNYTPQAAGSIMTAGGTFTTMNLNITAQNPRWKAYVGNVTGVLTLDDVNNKTIYNWAPTVVVGEVYASRTGDVVWADIACADAASVIFEQQSLNITADRADSIENTFNNATHKSFYVGTTHVLNNSCSAISTFVNDTRQVTGESALYQEVLLTDMNALVYATMLENRKYGFNNQKFDFQMILPTDEFAAAPTRYFFYVEIG